MPEPVSWTRHAGESLALGEGEAHLWKISPTEDFTHCLTSREAARCSRFSNPEAAMHYAAAQGGLRTILGRYLGQEPPAVSLLREERGKPYVAGGPEFNITHTGEQILLAVARVPVGLDVELAARPVSADELAQKFFTTREAEHLAGVLPSSRRETFLRYWVCKEATVKLSGDGIYHGLRDAEVTLGPEGGAEGRYRGRAVRFHEMHPAPGVLAALASWRPLQAKCFLHL